MNDRRLTGHPDDRQEEVPPFSRIFVVCPKQATQSDLTDIFEKYGEIESFRMPRDRDSGKSKGIAYIKYSKTSAAAAAINELHMKNLPKLDNKYLKVMVANHRNEDDNDASECKFTRLFIVVPKNSDVTDIRDHFSQFGKMKSCTLISSKKFAYVTYGSFLDTAKAFEECDRKYKAVFALPKEELLLKRNRENFEYNMPGCSGFNMSNRDMWEYGNEPFHDDTVFRNMSGRTVNSPMINQTELYKRISVTVTPQLPEKYIGSLFNVIPGMESFNYTVDNYNGYSKAIITYQEHKYAACAVTRLNNFEFPSGEVVSVKPDTDIISKAATTLTEMVQSLKNAVDAGSSSELVHLADAIAQASSLIKVATTSIAEPQDQGFCSVKLPPIQPIAESKATVAKRCFIVCKPHPPPMAALRDVFCCFGDLIDVTIFPTKNYGFVKYASEKAADNAIKTVHGATICGILIKVLEADEKPATEKNFDRKRQKMDNDMTDTNDEN